MNESDENESLMTHEEFVEIKEKMRKKESLSRLEVGFLVSHPAGCPVCKKELKEKNKAKKTGL